jgi:hypothetical protein
MKTLSYFLALSSAVLGQTPLLERAVMITGAPYTAEETQERGLPGGAPMMIMATSKIYRDSDGRERRETVFTPQLSAAGEQVATPTRIEITDPVAGYRYTLDNSHPVIYRTKLGAITRRAAPLVQKKLQSKTGLGAQHLSSLEVLGTEQFGSIQGFGTRTTSVSVKESGDQTVATTETWESPELGILLLRKSVDQHVGTVIVRLSNVQRGEPDPSLFLLPIGSQMMIDGPAPNP